MTILFQPDGPVDLGLFQSVTGMRLERKLVPDGTFLVRFDDGSKEFFYQQDGEWVRKPAPKMPNLTRTWTGALQGKTITLAWEGPNTLLETGIDNISSGGLWCGDKRVASFDDGYVVGAGIIASDPDFDGQPALMIAKRSASHGQDLFQKVPVSIKQQDTITDGIRARPATRGAWQVMTTTAAGRDANHWDINSMGHGSRLHQGNLQLFHDGRVRYSNPSIARKTISGSSSGTCNVPVAWISKNRVTDESRDVITEGYKYQILGYFSSSSSSSGSSIFEPIYSVGMSVVSFMVNKKYYSGRYSYIPGKGEVMTSGSFPFTPAADCGLRYMTEFEARRRGIASLTESVSSSGSFRSTSFHKITNQFTYLSEQKKYSSDGYSRFIDKRGMPTSFAGSGSPNPVAGFFVINNSIQGTVYSGNGYITYQTPIGNPGHEGSINVSDRFGPEKIITNWAIGSSRNKTIGIVRRFNSNKSLIVSSELKESFSQREIDRITAITGI